MSYEVWGEPDDVPECPYCNENRQEYEVLEKVTDDLASLVRRLAHALNKAKPNNNLANQAMDYLKRENLSGQPLRDDA